MTKKNLKHIVIVCNGINDVDASGEETLLWKRDVSASDHMPSCLIID